MPYLRHIVKLRQVREVFWANVEPWATFRLWAVPRLLRAVHSTLMCSLRFEVSGQRRAKPYLERQSEVGALFVVWHDETLVTLHLWRNYRIGALMSKSRAGRMQAAFWRLHEFPTTWGSSTRPREAVAALRDAAKVLKGGQCFAFTPDGPKGPRHKAQPGAVWIASNSGAPVLPIGVASSREWRLPTWDKYLIPKPFARVHVHMGAPLHIPPKLSREETEAWRQRMELALKEAQTQAQDSLNHR